MLFPRYKAERIKGCPKETNIRQKTFSIQNVIMKAQQMVEGIWKWIYCCKSEML